MASSPYTVPSSKELFETNLSSTGVAVTSGPGAAERAAASTTAERLIMTHPHAVIEAVATSYAAMSSARIAISDRRIALGDERRRMSANA